MKTESKISLFMCILSLVSLLGINNAAYAEEYCTELLYSDWADCDGMQQARYVTGYLPEGCVVQEGITPQPDVVKYCTIGIPCTSWDFSDWMGNCDEYPAGGLYRVVIASYPAGCESGEPSSADLYWDCSNFVGGFTRGDSSGSSSSGLTPDAGVSPMAAIACLALGLGLYQFSKKFRNSRTASI